MTSSIALLRAVNVGGTGKLSMSELRAMGGEVGFTDPRTCLASGNVCFSSRLGETAVRKKLEQRLLACAGKQVAVFIRSAEQMTQVLADNPFAQAPRNRVVAIFHNAAPDPSALAEIRHLTVEHVACGTLEIYVHYGDAMANSRLVIPAVKAGTARNMHTVARLAKLAAGR